jgi:hypothetical protein
VKEKIKGEKKCCEMMEGDEKMEKIKIKFELFMV